MKNFLPVLFLSFILFSVTGAHAFALSTVPPWFTMGAVFRQYKDTGSVAVQVPTVVEIPFDAGNLGVGDFAVFDKTNSQFMPYLFQESIFENKIETIVRVNDSSVRPERMIDNNFQTYAEFDLSSDARGATVIAITAAEPITSSSLLLSLDRHVALPTMIAISAQTAEGFETVVAQRGVRDRRIAFPETTARMWRIHLTYSQPMRITELELDQANAERVREPSVRFLAQPNHAYRIYFNGDRPVSPNVGERGDLRGDENIKALANLSIFENPYFQASDADDDKVPDVQDNCVQVSNSNQTDVDQNRRGDACDDFDQDHVINVKDNCKNLPNRDQRDTDGDEIGDVCDGAESRVTEKYPWLPWAGMGIAATVILVLFISIFRTGKNTEETEHREDLQ